MTWPTRDHYISGAQVPAWAGGPRNHDLLREEPDLDYCRECGNPLVADERTLCTQCLAESEEEA